MKERKGEPCKLDRSQTVYKNLMVKPHDLLVLLG